MSQREKCSICTGKHIVVGINDLATRNPIIAAMWHPNLNGDLTPQMVTEHSQKNVWWQHYHTKTRKWHEWPMPIGKLTSEQPRFCSVCHGDRIQVGINDLTTTHSTIASEWHPTKNKKLTPQMVTKGSNLDIWWQKDCFKDGILHIWHAMPYSRTSKRPSGCAICDGKQIQKGVNDLASQYPDIAKEWDNVKNKTLTPQMVVKSSRQKVFWKHKVKNTSIHGWSARISSRTSISPSGCPECIKCRFNLSAPATLYILSAIINKTQVIQFGISNNIQTRIKQHRHSGFTNPPVTLISFPKGSDARALEVSLMDLLKDYHVPTATQSGIRFDGSTEAFCLEDADEEFLTEFRELVGL
jgi:hypothetical protein